MIARRKECAATTDSIAISDCTHVRTRCTATTADGSTYVVDVGSDAEAESLARAIKLRGNIKPVFWRLQP
jgi:hypothetical protein